MPSLSRAAPAAAHRRPSSLVAGPMFGMQAQLMLLGWSGGVGTYRCGSDPVFMATFLLLVVIYFITLARSVEGHLPLPRPSRKPGHPFRQSLAARLFVLNAATAIALFAVLMMGAWLGEHPRGKEPGPYLLVTTATVAWAVAIVACPRSGWRLRRRLARGLSPPSARGPAGATAAGGPARV